MKFSIWLENTEEAGFEQDMNSTIRVPLHKFSIYADWLEDHERSGEANFIRNVVGALGDIRENNTKSAALRLSDAKKQEKPKQKRIYGHLRILFFETIEPYIKKFIRTLDMMECNFHNNLPCPMCNILQNLNVLSHVALAQELKNYLQPYMLRIKMLRPYIPELRNIIDLLESCPF